MASRNERGRDAGLRERLVGGVSLYVERPAALPGAGDAGRIENLIAELEERNAAGAQAARAGRLGGDLDEARKEIERSDKSRADYLKRFYDVDEEEATHYDLVVNTDLLSAEQAAAVVAAAAEV